MGYLEFGSLNPPADSAAAGGALEVDEPEYPPTALEAATVKLVVSEVF